MRSIDADAFEQDLKEKLLPLLVEKYGKEEAMKGLHFSLQDCISNIQSQPTITQPEPKWIPCSERLPEESGQYLITVKYKPVEGYEDVYAEHGEWDGEEWDNFCFGHCGEVESIVAWMPLPEPYRGEQK